MKEGAFGNDQVSGFKQSFVERQILADEEAQSIADRTGDDGLGGVEVVRPCGSGPEKSSVARPFSTVTRRARRSPSSRVWIVENSHSPISLMNLKQLAEDSSRRASICSANSFSPVFADRPPLLPFLGGDAT